MTKFTMTKEEHAAFQDHLGAVSQLSRQIMQLAAQLNREKRSCTMVFLAAYRRDALANETPDKPPELFNANNILQVDVDGEGNVSWGEGK